MSAKYGALVQPLSINKHSSANLVTENPTYTVVDIQTEPVYNVISPVGNNASA